MKAIKNFQFCFSGNRIKNNIRDQRYIGGTKRDSTWKSLQIFIQEVETYPSIYYYGMLHFMVVKKGRKKTKVNHWAIMSQKAIVWNLIDWQNAKWRIVNTNRRGKITL